MLSLFNKASCVGIAIADNIFVLLNFTQILWPSIGALSRCILLRRPFLLNHTGFENFATASLCNHWHRWWFRWLGLWVDHFLLLLLHLLKSFQKWTVVDECRLWFRRRIHLTLAGQMLAQALLHFSMNLFHTRFVVRIIITFGICFAGDFALCWWIWGITLFRIRFRLTVAGRTRKVYRFRSIDGWRIWIRWTFVAARPVRCLRTATVSTFTRWGATALPATSRVITVIVPSMTAVRRSTSAVASGAMSTTGPLITVPITIISTTSAVPALSVISISTVPAIVPAAIAARTIRRSLLAIAVPTFSIQSIIVRATRFVRFVLGRRNGFW